MLILDGCLFDDRALTRSFVCLLIHSFIHSIRFFIHSIFLSCALSLIPFLNIYRYLYFVVFFLFSFYQAHKNVRTQADIQSRWWIVVGMRTVCVIRLSVSLSLSSTTKMLAFFLAQYLTVKLCYMCAPARARAPPCAIEIKNNFGFSFYFMAN